MQKKLRLPTVSKYYYCFVNYKADTSTQSSKVTRTLITAYKEPNENNLRHKVIVEHIDKYCASNGEMIFSVHNMNLIPFSMATSVIKFRVPHKLHIKDHGRLLERS